MCLNIELTGCSIAEKTCLTVPRYNAIQKREQIRLVSCTPQLPTNYRMPNPFSNTGSSTFINIYRSGQTHDQASSPHGISKLRLWICLAIHTIRLQGCPPYRSPPSLMVNTFRIKDTNPTVVVKSCSSALFVQSYVDLNYPNGARHCILDTTSL